MSSPHASARAARDVQPLVWMGSFREPSGYADEARSVLRALELSGYAVCAREFVWSVADAGATADQRAAISRATARELPAGAIVAVHHYVPGPKQNRVDRGVDVARTMFETDSLPATWIPRLIDLDEVWVPTEFNLETFVRGGIPESRLRILPMTLDFELYRPGVRRLELPGTRGFTFLANFDFTDRKAWDALLDAWAAAFAPDDDVCLVLKCVSLHRDTTPETIRARIDAHLAGRATAPIVVNTDVLSVADVPRLYAACDAYVLASRGEGWGRPYMEAMAMGLPTIASRWSGNLAFMDDTNSWLVDGRVVEVPAAAQQHTPLYRGQHWFEPDREALVAELQAVARGGADVEARAARGRESLLQRFAPAEIANRVVDLTDEALDRARWRASRPVACAWRGDWGSGHSLSIVNEAVVSQLESDDSVVRRITRNASHTEIASVGIASQWPPDFDAPTDGPFVLYQPWEFGEIPALWVDRIRERVDEVWTPSEYSRASFVEAGVAPELVHVVPNGVDLRAFHPDGPVQPLEDRRATVFLYVGGTIYRKGIDLLLAAYGKAFTADDDVLLVIKGVGAGTYYRGQTAEGAIDAFRAQPGAPALRLFDEELPYAEVAPLYRAADCLVQPYRGEGFCLPALEALACGKPLIVTAGGPTDEFASDACAWRVPSSRIPLPPGSLAGEMAPAGGGFLLEPNLEELVEAFRAASDPVKRSAKARAARAHAERFSWSAAADVVRGRLAALAQTTPIRTIHPATIPDAKRIVIAVDVDWDEPASWVASLEAYAAAFGPDEDTTLVLTDDDGRTAFSRISSFLDGSGLDTDALGDVVVADPSDIQPVALELGADAFVCSGTRRPHRARRVLPADPAALRSLLSL